MITHDTMSKGQARWLALLAEFYPDIVKQGIITHKQLKAVDEYFREMRTRDGKKFKISFPIWLMVNNAIERGVYQLPIKNIPIKLTVDPDIEHKFYPQYDQELKSFGIFK